MNRKFGILGFPLIIALTAAAIALPPFMPTFYLHIIILIIIFAVFAMSLDILMGYAGLPSMGHAAFYGFGAYTAGLLCARYGGTWWQGVVLGLVASALLAALFGFVALRARGLYFLLITLALGQVLWGAANRWGSLTGGYNGLRGIPQYMQLFGTTLSAYYVALAVAALLAAIMYQLVRSPFGLSLQGLRDSETRMRALGYNVWLHKYIAFVVSALFAGAAGVMSAYYKGFVSPFDLSIAVSAEAILMVILGGTGTLFGPIIGAAIIVALRNFLSIFMNHWLIVLGLIFMLTVFIAPNGVIRWFTPRRRASATALPEINLQEVTDLVTNTEALVNFELAKESQGQTAINRKRTTPDLRLENVSKSFGGMLAVDNVSLQVTPGQRIAILGPNGAGKTSLFHLISGSLRPSNGRILLFGRDVSRLNPEQRVTLGLGRTFQITTLFFTLSVMNNIRLALFARTNSKLVMHHSANNIDAVNAEARDLLSVVGLWELRDIDVQYLSYGHQRQLEVIMALALRPMLLLLDEPTAGLSASESAQIVKLINRLDRAITLLIIEHDMDVALKVADRVIVFHHGQKVAEGSTDEIRANAKVREIYLGRHGIAE
jgi:ABC-type branched-subunit amino acid transport system permease subunit/ABC-type branched-subunit amino acid transport system ATPase component